MSKHPEDDTSAERTLRGDWSSYGTPSRAVAGAVAAASGRDHEDLPPFEESVDPGTLDDLLDRGGDGVTVQVRYAGWTVTLEGSGDLVVRPSPSELDESARDSARVGSLAGKDGSLAAQDGSLAADIRRLLREAHRRGTDVRGGYSVRNGDSGPDWDVHVTEVAAPGDDD